MTVQAPIGSGFTAASTTADVIAGIDLTGRTAIVTGGDSGLGLETVRTLASAGATVVVPVFDAGIAEGALADIPRVEIREMNLTDPASIDAFAAWFVGTGRPLRILVCSAGIMGAPLNRDARGFEFHFVINYLGHFQLTAGLWPALARANGARVVTVSSWGHRQSAVVFDDVNFEHRPYDGLAAYGQSKTADSLFAVALDKRGREFGVRAFTLHPGAAFTPLAKYARDEDLKTIGVLDERGEPVIDPSRDLKTVPQAAATHVWCATSPQLAGMGGVYCMNSDIAPLLSREIEARYAQRLPHTPYQTPPGVLPYAVDPEFADRLWVLSEDMLGVAFPL